MKYKAVLILILLPIIAAQAQEKSRFQFGIQSGNNLNPTSFGQNDWIEGNNLYRFSFGALVKQDLRKRIEMRWGGLRSKLHLYLHYGLNFVTKGYDYSVAEGSGFGDEFAFEVPFLLFIKRGNDQLTYRWKKKRINVFTGIGLKWSYSPKRIIERSLGTANSDGFVTERTEIGGQNILIHSYYGIMKGQKSGAVSAIGIAMNIGLRQTSEGQFVLLSNGTRIEESLWRTGTYFSLDLNHFFGKKRKIDIKDMNPVIFCPHF